VISFFFIKLINTWTPRTRNLAYILLAVLISVCFNDFHSVLKQLGHEHYLSPLYS